MELKGYKHTEIGTIPEDWDFKTMKDISWINQGLQISINNRSKNPSKKSKKYITIQFLKGNKELEYIDNFSQSVVCKIDDILMTRTGNTGEVITGVEGVFHNNFFKINFDKQQVEKDFLTFFLKSSQTQRKIIEKAGTSTIPDLNHKDFYTLQIPLPPLAEQKAIATALQDADALIDNLKQLITKKKDIKKGTMQQLLTGKKRLAGFTENWETKKLGEISEMFSGGTPLTSNKKFYNGNIPWVVIADISKANKYISATEKNITIDGLKNSSAKRFKKGTILFAMYASIGKVTISAKEMTCNQAILGINIKNGILEYVYYFLSYQEKKFIEMGQTGTQSNLSKEIAQNIDIPFPSIKEQTAIANILSDIDAEIEALDNQLAKYQNLKQAVMQELLTGKTRLIQQE